MNRKYAFVTIVLCLAFIAGVNAQRFGGNPASLKFYQLNTDTVRIIFPKGLESRQEKLHGCRIN
ncbi:MAG: hypothetical protein GXC73_05925 [Chitinophagaceae bacterium]|nr:hypothetical protein [Chitinophagaceae bacterium]